MIIGFKKLHPEAKPPFKKHKNDACYDVYATNIKDHGNGVIEYDLGISIEVPENYKLLLRPRSSIYNTGLILSNCVGVGDAGYTGEYKAFFYNVIPGLPNYKIGDRVLQIELLPRSLVTAFKEVEYIKETQRGDGGFGSTGQN